MNTLSLMSYAALGLVGISVSMTVYALGSHPPAVPPRLGHRGLKRKRELERNALFRVGEPAVRLIGGWMSVLPLHKTRERLERTLAYAGHWLGVSADEFIALLLLSGAFFSVLGVLAADFVGFGTGFAVFFGGLGMTVPYTRLTGEVADRFKSVSRQLPAAIDLASLCMGAGLDFPGALRQIVDKSPDKQDPIVEELERLLQELELGRTRRQALEAFAERVPTDAVCDFVGAVVQAEEKGNPLAEVLHIQAGMLRMRRSMMAEENAARAGVLMIAPLMFIFCAIIMILLGPFILKGMESGF